MIKFSNAARTRATDVADSLRAFRWFGYGWAVVALAVLSDAAHATLF